MILEKGHVINEDILKVDSFLNHQIDYNLMQEIGKAFYNYFKDKNITKIFTIESSGIAPAIMTATEFKVPMVFLKKQKPNTLANNTYQTDVKSFTKQISNFLSQLFQFSIQLGQLQNNWNERNINKSMIHLLLIEMNKYYSKIEFCLSSSFITFIKDLLLDFNQSSNSFNFNEKYNEIIHLFDWNEMKMKNVSMNF
jgi:hypothetical protein